jgi:YegS/Rv2252/BmrU family lipid kinase
MRYKIIVNPIAGKGYGERITPKIRQVLEGHGLDFDLVHSQWAGESVELARDAVLDGYDVVVAAGGDGTYQEVINGMLQAVPEARTNGQVVGHMGALAVGSGCDFCWSVGVPSDLEEACALLARAETKTIDLAQVTVDGEARYFDNTVGIGFEGTVNIEASKIKHLRGMALYLPAVLKSIFISMSPARSVIEYEQDGEMVQRKGSYLMIDACNGARAGGSFFVAPKAQIDDGLLDILLVEDMPRTRMLALLPKFLKGTQLAEPDVETFRTRRIKVVSQDALAAHVDGELVCTEGHSIECEIVPSKLSVVC